MPRNGSGTYSPPAGTAAVSLQPIASVPYNSFLTDISSEMTNSLPTTGVKAMGANLPMGGNKITNMADPTVSTDAATKNYVDNITHGKIVAVQVLTTTGTYTRSANATQGDIYVVGGGGGSGGCGATGASTVAIAGAGSGGAAAIAYNVALPATATVTIGAAGAAGASGANAGGAGGTTSFVGGALNISAPGAAGGGGGTPFSNAVAALVAQASTAATIASGGTVNMSGQPGSIGIYANTVLFSGSGGGSPLGGGGGDGTSIGAGPSPGSGAAAPRSGVSAAARAGFAGAPGIIIVVERT